MNLINQFVIEYVVDDSVEKLSARVIAKIIKTSSRTIQRELAYLQEKGYIKHIGSYANGHWEIITDKH